MKTPILPAKLRDWLNCEDYHAARRASVRRVVTKGARGNLLMQKGAYATQADLRARSARAQKILKRLAPTFSRD